LKGQTTGGRGGAVSRGTGKSDDLVIDASVTDAIKEVRSDGSGLNWLAASYVSPDSATVIVIGSGSGGVEELRSHLEDDTVVYALVRKIEQIDATEAVKFCYIRWIGPNVPRMQRAKLGTHAGAISGAFAPAHTQLDSPDLAEVTDENVLKAIKVASGTYMHVREGSPAQSQSQQAPTHQAPPRQQQQPRQAAARPVQAASETSVNFHDEEDIRVAIKSVRDDSIEVDFALVTYTAPKSNTLKLLATGSGGIHELKAHLANDLVVYGIFRSTDTIDQSVTVKFVLIDWRGHNINRMQKAVLATHSGAVNDLFSPYHVSVSASSEEELTEEIISGKIKNASGTAIHVL